MTSESFHGGRVVLHAGDCLDVLDALEENSVHACVCDPPYHLTSIVERFGKEGAAPANDAQHGGAFKRASAGFMGKQWDGGDIAFRPDVWRKVLRVLKPGGHLLAFAASRGYGHMQVAIEEAGFVTRDCILEILDADERVAAFVNSLNDAQRVAFLQIVVESSDIGGLLAWIFGTGFPKSHNIQKQLKRAGDPRADDFKGYGTALKPAFEPIVCARKPMIGSVAENMLAHGVGALNIAEARIGTSGGTKGVDFAKKDDGRLKRWDEGARGARNKISAIDAGRWPANVIHDGSAAVVAAFPESKSCNTPSVATPRGNILGGVRHQGAIYPGESGSASRFFFSPKAADDDRLGSKHPTVKPVDLMAYLVRLVTSKGQTVLDPFAGTGTTGEAAWREGRSAILIEREAEYRADIARRMALCLAGPEERRRETIKAKDDDKPFESGSLFAGF